MNTWIGNNLVRVANYSVFPPGTPNQGQYQSGGFQNALGQLYDPTTIVVTIKDPTGATTTPAPVKDAVGLYHVDVDTTGKPGTWQYSWGPQPYNYNLFRIEFPPL